MSGIVLGIEGRAGKWKKTKALDLLEFTWVRGGHFEIRHDKRVNHIDGLG